MNASVQKVMVNGRQSVIRKPQPKKEEVMEGQVQKNGNGKVEVKPETTPKQPAKPSAKAPKIVQASSKKAKAPNTPSPKKAPKKELTTKEKQERNERFKAYVERKGATWKPGSNSHAIFSCLKPNTGTTPDQIVQALKSKNLSTNLEGRVKVILRAAVIRGIARKDDSGKYFQVVPKSK